MIAVATFITEERNWVTAYVKKYKVSESNLVGNQSICYPVIDILPTLEAVRCFGMSSFEKVRLQDFASVTDLRYVSFLQSSICTANCIQGYIKAIRSYSFSPLMFFSFRPLPEIQHLYRYQYRRPEVHA